MFIFIKINWCHYSNSLYLQLFINFDQSYNSLETVKVTSTAAWHHGPGLRHHSGVDGHLWGHSIPDRRLGSKKFPTASPKPISVGKIFRNIFYLAKKSFILVLVPLWGFVGMMLLDWNVHFEDKIFRNIGSKWKQDMYPIWVDPCGSCAIESSKVLKSSKPIPPFNTIQDVLKMNLTKFQRQPWRTLKVIMSSYDSYIVHRRVPFHINPHYRNWGFLQQTHWSLDVEEDQPWTPWSNEPWIEDEPSGGFG